MIVKKKKKKKNKQEDLKENREKKEKIGGMKALKGDVEVIGTMTDRRYTMIRSIIDVDNKDDS